MRVTNQTQIIKDYFSKRPEAAAVYLFGSQSRGDQDKESDIDLAVLLRETSVNTFALQGTYLEHLSHELTRPVDVVILNDCDVSFAYRVVSQGKIVLERDFAARAAFVRECIRRYFDLKPTYEIYYKTLNQRIDQGKFASI